MTQGQAIKNHLQSGGKLTSLDALNKFGCFRLASRISELRDTGMNIETDMITLKNGKTIGEYSLKK